jgi:hypothetical protein
MLDDPRLPDSTEEPDIILVRTVDKQVTDNVSSGAIFASFETPGKRGIPTSNRLPALPLIGCRTRQLVITRSSAVEVVHQNVAARQVASDGIQVIPAPYFQLIGGKDIELTAYHPSN